MSLKISVDGVDITTDILAGFEQYTYETGKFYPSEGDTWLDLLGAITRNPTLKTSFFTAGVHRLEITDTAPTASTAKIWLKSKYSTRNR